MKLRRPLLAVILLSTIGVTPVLAGETNPKTGGVKAASSAAAPAASSAAPAATGGGDAGSIDAQTYTVRLRDLQQRVDALKERIRRSHTRLSLLSDTVLSDSVAGSHANIAFQNRMSSAFRVSRLLFVLDGAVQYNKSAEDDSLTKQKRIPIFTGSVPPGDHTLQVLVQLKGNGFGVFSYLKGYQFTVRSTHSFTAAEGKPIKLVVTAYEKGDATTPYEQRPSVRFQQSLGMGARAKPAPKPKGKASAGFSVGTGSK